jgi:hypothetical protein
MLANSVIVGRVKIRAHAYKCAEILCSSNKAISNRSLFVSYKIIFLQVTDCNTICVCVLIATLLSGAVCTAQVKAVFHQARCNAPAWRTQVCVFIRSVDVLQRSASARPQTALYTVHVRIGHQSVQYPYWDARFTTYNWRMRYFIRPCDGLHSSWVNATGFVGRLS